MRKLYKLVDKISQIRRENPEELSVLEYQRNKEINITGTLLDALLDYYCLYEPDQKEEFMGYKDQVKEVIEKNFQINQERTWTDEARRTNHKK